jgi:hypothetical protein
MKAYLINPNEATVTEVDYNDDWRTIKEWLGGPPCTMFTVVRLNHEGDAVYVDDEGLINGNPNGWFLIGGSERQPLKGFGLVLGADEAGKSIAPSASLEAVQRMIVFPKHVNEALIDKTIRVRPL